MTDAPLTLIIASFSPGVAFLTNATWLQLAGMTIEVTSTNAAIKSIG
jgi:hypothetical protein